MSDKTEQAKGRIKEAAGTVTGDESLESEGKTERLAGELKEHIHHVEDKIKDVVDSVVDRVKDVKK